MTTTRLAGFGTLLRFALRRDRVKMPAWVLGTVAFAVYCSQAVRIAVPNESDLASLTSLLKGAAGIVLVGPGYGFEHPTYENVFAGAYGLYVMILAICGAILLVGRHTRQEEEEGRLELVRALPVSRHTPLAVATTMLLIYCVLVTLACWGVLALRFDATSSLLFACSVGTVGMVFGGVTLVTAQLADHTRTATGYAFLALGAAFLVRGIGDTLGDLSATTERGSVLSWLSPLGWAQQTRVFVADRWWPLAFAVGATVVLISGAVAAQRHRDLGAGLVHRRGGSARGNALLSGPFGLAVRLQRAGLVGWSLAAVVMGVAYGALADQVASSLGGMTDPAILAALGGDASRITDGYFAVCTLFTVLLACGFAILAIQRLGADERSGRGELMLALPLGRVRWMGETALAAVAGAIVVLVVGGIAMGSAAAAVLGDGRTAWTLTWAAIVYLPAVLVVAGAAALGFAIHPALAGYAWFVVGYGFFISSLGKALGLPAWLAKLSVFEGIGSPPMWWPGAAGVWILTGLAVALCMLSLTRFRTRDLRG